MDATTQGATTTAQTTAQTIQTDPVPEEHRYLVQYIRDAMAEDGMDWRQTVPTKKYCMQMAVAAGREKCGDALGLKLREWVQTAPAYVADLPVQSVDQAPAAVELPVLEQTERSDGQTTHLSRLRFVPPFASLGLSAIMQVVIVTDLLGSALVRRYDTNADDKFAFFALAAAFGIGIACALEGSAAYILDLYKKHLLAQDSTMTLRGLLVVYVSGSAGLIHWWTNQRGLPWEMALVLSGLAASSIVLWIMGSKWENRVQMKANGQLDPAMPRLSTAAKAFHPVRWIRTMALTSWDPVQTTAEARERHAVWLADRAVRKAEKRQTKADQKA